MRALYWTLLSAANIPLLLVMGRLAYGSYGAFLNAFWLGMYLSNRTWTIEQAEENSDAIAGGFKARLVWMLAIAAVFAEDWFIRRMGWR